MDEQKDSEAIKEVSKAIAFKPDLQMLHLRAAFYESIGDLKSAVCDCEAALCLEPNHIDTLDLYNKARGKREGCLCYISNEPVFQRHIAN